MNLRFVEAFYWVVTLKSVSRAADKLHITQSAMSSRIAALEEELGVLLLDRRDRTFRLTVAGLRFFVHAQRLLALQRDIRADMTGNSQAITAFALRVGTIESVLHSWLLDWLKAMRHSHPDFELELTVETTPVLIDQVRRGALDLVFAALPAGGEGLHSRPLVPMEMVFVGHRELHRKRRYELADLAGVEFMTFQRGSQPHAALADLLRSAGLSAHRIHNISSISAMVQLVEQGFGVATLPRAAVEPLAVRQALRVLPVGARLAPLPIFASFRDDPGALTGAQWLDSVWAEILHHSGSSKKVIKQAKK